MILHREVAAMELTGSIRPILERKGGLVCSVSPSDSVYKAIEMMAEKQVGALIVLFEDKIVGIISERDYARKVILKGYFSRELTVAEIMSSPVITVTPNHTLAQCMQIITDHRIRHLPVLEGDRLVGVISIGDLVNAILTEQSETIRHLEAYISGRPG
jgi:CBS domain-containing protein